MQSGSAKIIHRFDPESVSAITKQMSLNGGCLDLPEKWIVDHMGRWSHLDWLELIRQLEFSPFWPMNMSDVKETLEERMLTAGFTSPVCRLTRQVT